MPGDIHYTRSPWSAQRSSSATTSTTRTASSTSPPRGRASTFDLTVPDSRDEDAYRPALESAGFRVLFREPVFHEHRFARCDAPPANIHIWSPCRAPEGSAA